MRAQEIPTDPVAPLPAAPAGDETVAQAQAQALAPGLRETSGMTTRLVLEYANREGGRPAVERLLTHAGCSGREAELRDESAWVSRATKISLFQGLCRALDDPDAVRKAGASVLELSIGSSLRVALRALGSPPMVYRNIVRVNSNFSAIHTLEMLEMRREGCTLAFSEHAGYGVHPLECAYTQGLLSTVPVLFGLPPARIGHTACACDGHHSCTYDVRWRDGNRSARGAVGVGLLAAASLLAASFAAPAALPALGAFSALVVADSVLRADRGLRAQRRHLEEELQDKDEVADGLTDSLQDLVAELDLGEVLDKIVSHASSAVSGREFLLIVADDGVPYSHASSDVPVETTRRLEAWVAAEHARATEIVLVEDVGAIPALASLQAQPTMPIGSICLAPLAYRGTTVGALLALAQRPNTFLPRDLELVGSYAIPAAIALANARHFAAQRSLATRDSLTGLLNHREFHEALEHELERARRAGGDVGVALLDLDGFKVVNDSAGHAEGDRILRAVATAMEETCRSSDLAFRIGGDEFALLLPGTGHDDAAAVASRVQEAIDTIDDRVGVSFGVACWPGDGGSKDVVLAGADAALYEMKRTSDHARPARAGGPRVRRPAEPRSDLRDHLLMANRLCEKLTPVLEPQRIAETVVTELHESFGYRLSYVHRVEDDRLQMLTLGGTATESLSVPLSSQSIDEGVSGRVVRTGRTAHVRDTALDADHIGAERVGLTEELPLRSELAVPVRVRGRVWGVLSIQDGKPNAFGPNDVLLLELVGAQVAAALHRSELYTELDGAFSTTLGVLGDALEAKDDYTAEHARDVGELARRVAVRLGIDEDGVRAVHYAALLHDIGKIGVRTEILTKPGPLSESERREMQRHSAIGAELLASIPFFADVFPLVRGAHERWDGCGYPDRLAREAIPLGARIISACDAFDAMTSDRPYRAAQSTGHALSELRRCSSVQFDPRVVEALIAEVARRQHPTAEPERAPACGAPRQDDEEDPCASAA